MNRSLKEQEFSLTTHDLHGDPVLAGAGGQELFGYGFSLGQVGTVEYRSGPVLIDDHGGSGVNVGSVQHSLSQFLNIP